MKASLVWDGTDILLIPESMGLPREDQMRGTIGERLGEINGRICYDSLGKGRSSISFHEHISQVKHFSVYEHYMVTLELPITALDKTPETHLLMVLINRPGIWVEDSLTSLRITLNPRVILDWDEVKKPIQDLKQTNLFLKLSLRNELERLCPEIFKHFKNEGIYASLLPFKQAEAKSEDEKWVSLYMQGSRGFSHEQVRHGDFSAISQRSTRYVDEGGNGLPTDHPDYVPESEWVQHPLTTAFFDTGLESSKYLTDLKVDSGRAYRRLVRSLEPWLIEKGVDKTTARKQARGAARGYLGNALSTELIFSASVTQWKRQLKQRLNAAADAEIRQIYVPVLEALKASRYADCFENYSTRLSPDGIGLVLE